MMGKKILTFVALFILGASLTCHADDKSFEIRTSQPKSEQKVSFDVPAGWEDVKDLFGMPLTFLGPEEGGARPTVVVGFMNEEGYKFDSEGLKNTQKQYQDGRLSWLKQVDGQLVEFKPKYSKETVQAKPEREIHRIGVRYKINGTTFQENSYFVSCGQKLYHLKSLLRSQQEKSSEKKVEKLIRSFKC